MNHSIEITAESDPDLYEAGWVAVEKRLTVGLTSQSGWSMAHMANSYARLGQGDRALECLELSTRGSTGPNLWTYHNDWRHMGLTLGDGSMPPFQIDANFGITAAILEMLVFSKPGLVKLLPALPAKWTCGRAAGIQCRGGITVDMDWDCEAGTIAATLVIPRDQSLQLEAPGMFEAANVEPASACKGGDIATSWIVELTKGAPLTVILTSSS